MARRIVKKKLPAVALRSLAVLPGMIVHFDLTRPASVKAVEKAMIKDQRLFLIAQKEEECEKPGRADLCRVGTIAMIKQLLKLPNNVVRVLVEGECRAELFEISEEEYLESTVRELIPADDWSIDKDESDILSSDSMSEEEMEAALKNVTELTAKVNTLRELMNSYLSFNPKISKAMQKQFDDAKTLSQLLDCVASCMPMKHEDRQKLLESVDLSERFMVLTTILAREIEVLNIRKDIGAQIKERVDKNQREYVLREQMRVIKEELGEGSTATDEETYREQVGKLKASKAVKDRILKEIDRFGQLHDTSSEAAVARGYIETLLALPWDKASKDNKDIDNAQRILDEDHYGLDKVKERILEFLAVRNLTSKGESPIICLVGPPGTGKTSIAKSVAKALDKKYVRICLGGVRDEAEIRGHRRTYVGAMPGRIVAGIKNAGVKNPLMLLDEIDKMSSDYKGDTASAMLEVLDSEQNSHFSDHYVEIPVDLSEVLFIATANSAADIPRPLLDRMEIIEVSGYTENEKMHIAKEHLFAKQLSANGLKADQLTIADTAMELIIRGYTKEAGVRGLERKIGEICRKSARRIYQDGKKSVRVTKANLKDLLGNEKYEFDKANEYDEIGIVRGLAWTSVGGDTLEIEVNVMPGKGELMLTGKLGDVMKESAQAGISYIRSVADKYGISEKFFSKNDIHIHIPEGSVPKDGPSAGITMATAMLSAIIKKPVRADIAMTGEITLRGRVLPIGGLKEKTLAAKNAGIREVLVPGKNRKDIEEIDDEIKTGLKITFVDSMDEVIGIALAE